MKAVILYRPRSDHARTVEEYIRNFELTQNKTLEVISLDTKEGASLAALYDLIQYPAILVLRDDGQLVKEWQGPQLPLARELVGYMSL